VQAHLRECDQSIRELVQDRRELESRGGENEAMLAVEVGKVKRREEEVQHAREIIEGMGEEINDRVAGYQAERERADALE
jgi:hypothetical protein